MREYNELHHLFDLRIKNSQKAAKKYLDQFDNPKKAIFFRFIALLSSIVLSILLLLGFFSNNFLTSDWTNGKSGLFYIGIFTVLLAASKSAIPNELSRFEPIRRFEELFEYTRYNPLPWQGKQHTRPIYNEISSFYELKIIILAKEFFSILTTPFQLYFYYSQKAGSIISFFKTNSVFVNGLGFVCSSSLFLNSNEDEKFKSSKSHFKSAYPKWSVRQSHKNENKINQK